MVSLASGTLTLVGATTFDFPTGMFQWTGGEINTSGYTLTNASTGFMTIANPTGSDVLLAGCGALVNQGTIDETGTGELDFQSAWGNSNSTTLDNQAGATFDFQDDGGIGDGGNGGTLSNEGTFTKTGGSGTSTVGGIIFSNTGIVAAESGTLELDCGAAQVSGDTLTGGTWNVLAGATLSISGAAVTTNDGEYHPRRGRFHLRADQQPGRQQRQFQCRHRPRLHHGRRSDQ